MSYCNELLLSAGTFQVRDRYGGRRHQGDHQQQPGQRTRRPTANG